MNKPAGVIRATQGRTMNVLGHTVTLKLSRNETNGDYYTFELLSPPGLGVPPHVHEHEARAGRGHDRRRDRRSAALLTGRRHGPRAVAGPGERRDDRGRKGERVEGPLGLGDHRAQLDEWGDRDAEPGRQDVALVGEIPIERVAGEADLLGDVAEVDVTDATFVEQTDRRLDDRRLLTRDVLVHGVGGDLGHRSDDSGVFGVADPARPQVEVAGRSDELVGSVGDDEGGHSPLSRLVDEQRTGEADAAREAGLLLELLTPIAKSWPSEWCLEANSLAIQVLGGYGYTRDYPVEQHWRDNRLNMIHEGTHGIQAADLLGRKVIMQGGAGLQLLARTIEATIAQARQRPELAPYADQLAQALKDVGTATQAAWATGNPNEALANAVPYMQAFGHMVLAWMWLDVACKVLAQDAMLSIAASAGRMGATRYFFHYELPRIGAWLRVVSARDATCMALADEAF